LGPSDPRQRYSRGPVTYLWPEAANRSMSGVGRLLPDGSAGRSRPKAVVRARSTGSRINLPLKPSGGSLARRNPVLEALLNGAHRSYVNFVRLRTLRRGSAAERCLRRNSAMAEFRNHLIPGFIMIDPLRVMAGLVPAIHVWFCSEESRGWHRTSGLPEFRTTKCRNSNKSELRCGCYKSGPGFFL
jgi:hypothetical protein